MNLRETLSLDAQIQDAHRTTMSLIDGLNSRQMIGPLLSTVNPLLWEIGHAAYFYEYWVLRQHLKQKSINPNSDSLYDSITIAHDDRWDLPLPSQSQTLDYINLVHERVINSLQESNDDKRNYLTQYAIFHHDMHNEAYTYTRQTLEYPTPHFPQKAESQQNHTEHKGDAQIPGGKFSLGAAQDSGFVFDNEKWAHEHEVEPFAIAKTATSYGQFRQFVEADGYSVQQYWDDKGWNWLQQNGLKHPVYWRQSDNGWQIRQFETWQALPENAAVMHVNWHEAQAYCRWAGRRLPTELEWEVAAAAEPDSNGLSLAATKRCYPWGNESPNADHANLDFTSTGTIDVNTCALGDSAFGCRQMIGNVWEWTQDTFQPYPGFEPDMYADYSQPLFGITKVLRGGSWATRSRMIRNTWRTYYGAERNDVFAGFRTCETR